MKIGLNAHLLSRQPGYRAAGIHSYIANLLKHLPACAPTDWSFEAMVGAANAHAIDGVQLSRSRFDTHSPLRRIFWEQVFQPAQLRQYDLYHALAFVAPIVLNAPMVVTVYDLSFLHFPDRLSAARRWYLRAFTALTCRRARRVLAISRSTADDLSRLLGVPRGKIDVTPARLRQIRVAAASARNDRGFQKPPQFAAAILALPRHVGAAQEPADAAARLRSGAEQGSTSPALGRRERLDGGRSLQGD